MQKHSTNSTVQMVHVCLRYIAAFLKFEGNVKPITLKRYDNYSIIAIYRLADALRRVIDVNMDADT